MNENKKYWLFLDDERTPIMAYDYTRKYEYALVESWIIVRNYDQFVATVSKRGLPELVSFDHDLADVHYGYLHGDIPYDKFTEKTGMHCAQWMVDYCLDNGQLLPNYMVHSMNPAGKKNIKSLLDNFKKFQSRNPW
jgi:hypothetical protein